MIRALGLAVLTALLAAWPAAAQTLNDYDTPFVYRYLGFDNDQTAVSDGVAHIRAEHGRGGAGHTTPMDLSRFADQTPVLSVKLGPDNQAASLRLVVSNADDVNRVFTYDLSEANAETFTAIYPEHGLPLSPRTLEEPDQSFDPAKIVGNHLQGDWKNTAVDVYVERVAMKPVPEALKAAGRQYAEKLRAAAEREREKAEQLERERRAMLAGDFERSDDGPRVVRVAPVADDVLAVYLEEMTFVPGGQRPYEAREGDEIRVEPKNPRLVWSGGRPAMEGRRALMRKDDRGRLRDAGTMVDHDRVVAFEATATVERLSAATAGEAEAYRIRSDDDAAYAEPVTPTAVHRKSVPKLSSSRGPSVDHAIYLELPSSLKAGATYRIAFKGLNTAPAEAEDTHEPARVRTEALHVSHIGFRPGDPLKRAYLSLWLGDGGAMAFDVEKFDLLDAATGAKVFSGSVKLALGADQPENLSGQVNRTKTNVYRLDFSAFRTPGAYVVSLPGVGISYPFRIADDVYGEALKASMQGLLAHRSGIALDASFSEYVRPRPMHPDDGFVVFQADVTIHEGESGAIRESMTRLLGPDLDDSKLQRLPFAWGGYMDAGDWDRRSQHLHVSMLLMEAFEQAPDRLSRLKLALPPDEATNAIPDLLDEALWNVSFYRRLQRADGAVRGGIESTEHPRGGEASWQESQLVAAFDVDPVTTYRYAASAARASRLVEPYHKALAAELRGSAVDAWRWAEAEGEASIRSIARRDADAAGKCRNAVPEEKALAAVELYRLTEDPSYHEAFRSVTVLAAGGDPGRQWDAVSAYAAMPGALADAALHQAARDAVIGLADASLAFQQGNAFGIAMRAPLPLMGFVGYYTTPETIIGPVLTRAHALTGERKYLAGTEAAAQYTLGANPMNITMTTGLGHDWPRAPLHVDSRNTGTAAPRGITVYGNTDPTRAPGWVRQWVLGSYLHPAPEAWPAAEFYVDVGNWPEMNEYTVQQSIGPAAYYWAYLHGSDR